MFSTRNCLLRRITPIPGLLHRTLDYVSRVTLDPALILLQCRTHSILMSRRHPFRTSFLKWRKRYSGKQASQLPASSLHLLPGPGAMTLLTRWPKGLPVKHTQPSDKKLYDKKAPIAAVLSSHPISFIKANGQALLAPKDSPQPYTKDLCTRTVWKPRRKTVGFAQ